MNEWLNIMQSAINSRFDKPTRNQKFATYLAGLDCLKENCKGLVMTEQRYKKNSISSFWYSRNSFHSI